MSLRYLGGSAVEMAEGLSEEDNTTKGLRLSPLPLSNPPLPGPMSDATPPADLYGFINDAHFVDIAAHKKRNPHCRPRH